MLLMKRNGRMEKSNKKLQGKSSYNMFNTIYDTESAEV